MESLHKTWKHNICVCTDFYTLLETNTVCPNHKKIYKKRHFLAAGNKPRNNGNFSFFTVFLYICRLFSIILYFKNTPKNP